MLFDTTIFSRQNGNFISVLPLFFCIFLFFSAQKTGKRPKKPFLSTKNQPGFSGKERGEKEDDRQLHKATKPGVSKGQNRKKAKNFKKVTKKVLTTVAGDGIIYKSLRYSDSAEP